MDGDLHITRSRFGPTIVLRMQGVLSASSTSLLVEELGPLLDQPAVLIDMREVTTLDERGFAAMGEYLAGAARHGPAFAVLTERDSSVRQAVERLRGQARRRGMGETRPRRCPRRTSTRPATSSRRTTGVTSTLP
jgi:anti-anti-sigma regulatory factor